MVALCNRYIGQTIIFLPCDFYLLSSSIFFLFLAYSQRSEIGCLPYFHTWCGLSGNLECRSETCCARLAENTGRKKSPKSRHMGTIPQLCRAISSQLRHISTIGKNLLSSLISSTCLYNMVNVGPLAAEIVSLVWGTPANFNGFRVLAALLNGTLVVWASAKLCGVEQRVHLYSAGRPSRWAFDHFSSLYCINV